jgi:hypothetical protein
MKTPQTNPQQDSLHAFKQYLQECDDCLEVPDVAGAFNAGWRAMQKAPVQPVAFLANGTRFKISYDSRQSGGQIHGIPPELGGRWVAFVAAEDDCHLKLATPTAQPAPCTWTQSPHHSTPDTYHATCGAVWTFTDGGPTDNDMHFCPKCGNKVVEGGAA